MVFCKAVLYFPSLVLQVCGSLPQTHRVVRLRPFAPLPSPVCLPEVLQCFLATREAMQLQQNETVYESSGTSTLPCSAESPGSPEREPVGRPWDRRAGAEEGLSFPTSCQLVVSRCVFLLLGVRPAWQEPQEAGSGPGENAGSRFVCAGFM